ncbi:putative nuclease HARBI1 [Acyrthosiphon pisum]|uniref:DDE Tnp4 domain-containing protein n=1 Tax=Acyrthosiphon pisum TaxID=7029 RepID=A0A8R2B3W2_ACYPI|nr:putative nuclease HARBI1 [Acyrthosiphon pisum]|eukprot:XP_008179271.1 PREDICTED: putative nuclease HARBI1 [Acyrthosiphon pisum]
MDDLDLFENLRAVENLEIIEMDAEIVRNSREALNPFQHLSDRQFIGKYRLSKDLCQIVIDMVRPFMKEPSRQSALTIERKVLTALRFLAAGSYQLDVGENSHSLVSQPSVSRIIEEFVNAVNNPSIFEKYVYFPRNFEELNGSCQRFYNKYSFPGIIGVIDCTHVAIVPPKTEDNLYPEHIYVNRKGYHSINTQLICDADLKIINVSAKFPGSANDACVWNSSNVKTFLMDLHENGHASYFLLGDSGYALRPWLMTPYLDPAPLSPEASYNNAFCSIRSTIERCIGVLKMRFRCLLKHRVLHYTPNKASKIINTCVVLHNMCITDNVSLVDVDEDEIIDFGIYQTLDETLLNNRGMVNLRNPELSSGRHIRDQIVQTLFNN